MTWKPIFSFGVRKHLVAIFQLFENASNHPPPPFPSPKFFLYWHIFCIAAFLARLEKYDLGRNFVTVPQYVQLRIEAVYFSGFSLLIRMYWNITPIQLYIWSLLHMHPDWCLYRLALKVEVIDLLFFHLEETNVKLQQFPYWLFLQPHSCFATRFTRFSFIFNLISSCSIMQAGYCLICWCLRASGQHSSFISMLSFKPWATFLGICRRDK